MFTNFFVASLPPHHSLRPPASGREMHYHLSHYPTAIRSARCNPRHERRREGLLSQAQFAALRVRHLRQGCQGSFHRQASSSGSRKAARRAPTYSPSHCCMMRHGRCERARMRRAEFGSLAPRRPARDLTLRLDEGIRSPQAPSSRMHAWPLETATGVDGPPTRPTPIPAGGATSAIVIPIIVSRRRCESACRHFRRAPGHRCDMVLVLVRAVIPVFFSHE